MNIKMKVCNCGRQVVKVYNRNSLTTEFCGKCGQEFIYEIPQILGVYVRTEETEDPSYASQITIKELKELLNEKT